jgi:hypothetical protein
MRALRWQFYDDINERLLLRSSLSLLLGGALAELLVMLNT